MGRNKEHNFYIVFGLFLLQVANPVFGQKTANPDNYLNAAKTELQKKWPNNKTLNLVFHGHSVPAGYRTNGIVNTLESYPYETLKYIKKKYPFAVVNVIVTAIGGEQSEQGAKRFGKEVLSNNPTVLFIDYALNDRNIGLEKAKNSWEQMIQKTLEKNIKVILLTPTPDLRENILNPDAELAKHSKQIRQLSKKYGVGLVDSYAIFQELAKKRPLKIYMAQNNHINDKGHQLIAEAIFEYFKK